MATLRERIDSYLINSLLNVTPNNAQKAPLSLQTTTSNFKRFVQKSGPIFAGQDAVEAILRWDNTAQTTLVGIAYAFLCFYPFLLLVLPNFVLITVLLSTYPQTNNNSRTKGGIAADHFEGSSTAPPPVAATNVSPAEGSVDYLANLQNIQIMMGRIADLSDLGISLTPYLTWTHPHSTTSLVLLQLSCLTTLLLSLFHALIPWRIMFFVIGEFGLLAGHPVTQSLLAGATPFIETSSASFSRQVRRIIKDDQLTEEELMGTLLELEKFSVERFVDGSFCETSWTAGNDAFALGGAVGVEGDARMEGEGKEWRWIEGEGWEIDFEGLWADGVVDDAGWVYLFIDGRRCSTASIQPGNMITDTPSKSERSNLIAQARKRRWVRRAIKL